MAHSARSHDRRQFLHRSACAGLGMALGSRYLRGLGAELRRAPVSEELPAARQTSSPVQHSCSRRVDRGPAQHLWACQDEAARCCFLQLQAENA